MTEALTCTICRYQFFPETGPAAAEGPDVCPDCADIYGVPKGKLPQARPLKPCAECGHHVLVRSIIRERGAEGGQGRSYVVPLGVTINKQAAVKFWSGEPKVDAEGNPVTLNALDYKASAGILQAYVCRACGYTELYATSPGEIPIGREYGTELIEVPETGPYR